MGYFQVRYDSRGVNYDRRGFIRLATGLCSKRICNQFPYTDKQNIRGLWGYFENITICVNTDAIFGRQLSEKHINWQLFIPTSGHT